MRKTLSIVLCAMMVLSLCCFGVSAAEGTAINSAADFAAMTADGTYYLNADITVSATWGAAASADEKATPFTGTLDGNGHTVTVTVPMFADLNGTVKNLTINGSIVAVDARTAALAIDSTENVVLENVTNNASITVTGTAKDVYAAGIIGYAQGFDNQFTNCVNNGDVNVTINGGVDEYLDGGTTATPFKPRAAGIGAVVEGGVFRNCVNNGEIVCNGTSGVAGGVVARGALHSGVNIIEMYNCTNTGNVSGYCTHAAGMVGYLGCKGNIAPYVFYGCVNTGDMQCTSQGAGIVAYCYATGSNATAYIDVEFCVNTGSITYGRPLKDGAEQLSYASQFVAYTNGNFTIIKYNVGCGEILFNDGAVCSFVSFVGLSSADATIYEIADNYIVDVNNKLTHYSYAGEYPQNRLEKAYGVENGMYTFVTMDELASGKVAYEINKAATGVDGYTFYQTIGTDKIPTLSNTSEYVVFENGVYKNGKAPETTVPVETTKAPDPETTPAETTTSKPEDTAAPSETTKAPASEETTKAPASTTAPSTGDKKSGCGGAFVCGIAMIAILGGAIVVTKKHD